MEERKLTDEEIVKALEVCSDKKKDCVDCPLYKVECGSLTLFAINLIHRLQAENERMTEERNLRAKNCRYLLEKNSRQKELIEQMHNAYIELQKQVDELRERYLEESKERLEFEQRYKKIQHAHNIGLGAQRSQWEKKVQQAVKDTAKEICDLILEHWEKKQFVECDWLRVLISEKYGVEVE